MSSANEPLHVRASTTPRSVLVTGASGGIGRAITMACATAGRHVGVHYHRGKVMAEDILQRAEDAGGSGAIYQADVRDACSVEHMVRAFARNSPPPLAFVCAAGVGGARLVLTLPEDEWAEVVTTNLTGLFHCLRAMAPPLRAQGGGSIVVIGSYAAYQGSAGQAAYAASKAGQLGLVKTAALEWGIDNICVNLIWPGWHNTALTAAAGARKTEWCDHALRRPPALDEVVRTVVHLTEANDVSGQVWNCDSRSVCL